MAQIQCPNCYSILSAHFYYKRLLFIIWIYAASGVSAAPYNANSRSPPAPSSFEHPTRAQIKSYNWPDGNLPLPFNSDGGEGRASDRASEAVVFWQMNDGLNPPMEPTIYRPATSPDSDGEELLRNIRIANNIDPPPTPLSSTLPVVPPFLSSAPLDDIMFDSDPNRRMERSVLPARRVCEKGYLDGDLDVCVYLDRKDKREPTYSCPEGSVLDGDYCFGKITSDFELECPRNFQANEEGVCVQAVVYSPTKLICPQGFEVKAYTTDRIKQCVKTVYVKPKKRVVAFQRPPTLPSCDPKVDRLCPSPPIVRIGDGPKHVLECDEGVLVKKRNSGDTACRVRLVVPPDIRQTCRKGYSWSKLDGAGGGCLRLSAYEARKVCPYPNKQLGPGLGDWATPKYKYDEKDKCVAYKAKAVQGTCGGEGVAASSYVLYNDNFCYRRYYLPYYYDCNNLEGYGFYFDRENNIGLCVFEFNNYKWSGGVNYNTKKTNFENFRISLFSNVYEVHDAYNLANSLMSTGDTKTVTAE